MEKIVVKLNRKLEKRNACLVDPESGAMITPNSGSPKSTGYDRQHGLEVQRTNFITARISAGELIEVTPSGSASTGSASGGDENQVFIEFLESTKVGKNKFEAGDGVEVPRKLADSLIAAGKAKIKEPSAE